MLTKPAVRPPITSPTSPAAAPMNTSGSITSASPLRSHSSQHSIAVNAADIPKGAKNHGRRIWEHHAALQPMPNMPAAGPVHSQLRPMRPKAPRTRQVPRPTKKVAGTGGLGCGRFIGLEARAVAPRRSGLPRIVKPQLVDGREEVPGSPLRPNWNEPALGRGPRARLEPAAAVVNRLDARLTGPEVSRHSPALRPDPRTRRNRTAVGQLDARPAAVRPRRRDPLPGMGRIVDRDDCGQSFRAVAGGRRRRFRGGAGRAQQSHADDNPRTHVHSPIVRGMARPGVLRAVTPRCPNCRGWRVLRRTDLPLSAWTLGGPSPVLRA